MANISLAIPSIHPMLGFDCLPASNHQPEFTAACVTAVADDAVLGGATAMAWTCVDIATDAGLREPTARRRAPGLTMARGLTGGAVIAGFVERTPERQFTGTPRSASSSGPSSPPTRSPTPASTRARSTASCCGGDIGESSLFVPATIAEYCGWSLNFAERLDLGGASARSGMVWRAAAAIELGHLRGRGVRDRVRAPSTTAAPGWTRPTRGSTFGASSNEWGSPQAEFDIPYGNVAQNCGYAMYAQRYHDLLRLGRAGRAKIVADQRVSACANPSAVFFGQPITVDDVLASPVIADPLHLLEIVMPCTGGAAFVVTSAGAGARGCRTDRSRVVGFGEHLTHKTPTYAAET